jgi:hypothetical protein
MKVMTSAAAGALRSGKQLSKAGRSRQLFALFGKRRAHLDLTVAQCSSAAELVDIANQLMRPFVARGGA